MADESEIEKWTRIEKDLDEQIKKNEEFYTSLTLRLNEVMEAMEICSKTLSVAYRMQKVTRQNLGKEKVKYEMEEEVLKRESAKTLKKLQESIDRNKPINMFDGLFLRSRERDPHPLQPYPNNPNMFWYGFN